MDDLGFRFLLPPPLAWIADLAELIAEIDPWIYYPTLAASALACLALRFGRPSIRPWCAWPFAALFALCAWAGLNGEPPLLVMCALSACPLALWLSRAHLDDPMRRELLGDGAD